MKKNIVALVFLFVVFVSSGYSQTGSPFTSKDGRYSVTAPAGFDNFEFQKRDSPAPGTMVINQYSMNLGRGTCIMAFYDPPDSVMQSKSVQKMLEDARDGAVDKGKAILDDQENITLDGYPALAMNVHIPDDKFVIYAHVVFVVATSRVYNLLFLSTDKAELSKPDVIAYFKSLKVQK